MLLGKLCRRASAARATAQFVIGHLDRRRHQVIQSHAFDARRSSAWHSSAGLATKAEEFDLITPDKGLAVIEEYDETGFLVSGVKLQGAILCAGDMYVLWRAASLADVTPDSLSILQLIRPAPDLLVLGCGARLRQVPEALRRHAEAHNLAIEALDTANAISTFNILNQEGRKVAAALLPCGAS